MTMVSFAMFGLMFTTPQYFQDVRGATPLGSGVRLLPLIGRMLVGMVAAAGSPARPSCRTARAASRGSARSSPWRLRFFVMAAGLAISASAGLGSSTGFAVLWITVTGLGLGLAMPAAMNAAVAPLTAERSASGGALISAVRQVGATIGVAVLGTLISNGYTSQLHLDGLPASAAAAVKSSVAGGAALFECGFCFARLLFLFGIMEENRGAVLRSEVGTLAVERRRIVALKKERQ